MQEGRKEESEGRGKEGRFDEWVDGQDRRMAGWVDGWMMDGWTDGWVGGWMDG